MVNESSGMSHSTGFHIQCAKIQNKKAVCKFFGNKSSILTFQYIIFMYQIREAKREARREGKRKYPPVLHPLYLSGF